MRPRESSAQRLWVWINLLSVKRWPENSTIQRLRALFSKTTNRLIVGAICGFATGAGAAILGIELSEVDLSDPETRARMVKLVLAFAAAGALVLAFFADFLCVYLRFLQSRDHKWKPGSPGKGRPLWDRELVSESPDSIP
jgi:hypothetical protein